MGHYLEDENLLAGIQNSSNEPEFVAANVEHNAITNNAGRAEIRFDIAPSLPLNRSAVDVCVPRPKRSFGIPALGQRPKPSQPRLGDNPHPMLLRFFLSASSLIVVRKIRTGNKKVRKIRSRAVRGEEA
jgi:hypothetical protein